MGECAMSKELLDEMQIVLKRKDITEGCEEFVMGAYNIGAISARETEGFLHPMKQLVGHCMRDFEKCKEPTSSFVQRFLRKGVAVHDTPDVVDDNAVKAFTTVSSASFSSASSSSS